MMKQRVQDRGMRIIRHMLKLRTCLLFFHFLIFIFFFFFYPTYKCTYLNHLYVLDVIFKRANLRLCTAPNKVGIVITRKLLQACVFEFQNRKSVFQRSFLLLRVKIARNNVYTVGTCSCRYLQFFLLLFLQFKSFRMYKRGYITLFERTRVVYNEMAFYCSTLSVHRVEVCVYYPSYTLARNEEKKTV